LAGVGADDAGGGFFVVEFGEDFDGQGDGVLVELEERLRVVEQDVGVEDVDFAGVAGGRFSGGHRLKNSMRAPVRQQRGR